VRRIIDLSAPIITSPPQTPEFQRTTIEYVDHAAGAAEIEALYEVPRRLLRDGEGWTRETIVLGSHNSTHVDAPYHYNSVIQGRPAATIDELPLDLFVGPGVVCDFRDRADGEAIDMAALQEALAHLVLEAGDIYGGISSSPCSPAVSRPDRTAWRCTPPRGRTRPPRSCRRFHLAGSTPWATPGSRPTTRSRPT
jgi:Putative cyclase